MRVATKFGSAPTPCESDYDGEVEDYGIVLLPPVGIIESSSTIKPIVYPNPTTGNFAIDLGNNHESITITITDIAWRLIQSNSYKKRQILNLKFEEAPGVYILIITAGDEKSIIRLLKE